MTALTSCRFTVGEDPAVAISPPGFAIPPFVESRSWPCPFGALVCKALPIGSELPRFPAPAVRHFPVRAAPPAAGLPADTPSQVSSGSLRCLPQAPRPSPATQRPPRPGPAPAKGFQDSSTVARSGAHFPPASQSLCDKPPVPRPVWPPTPGSIRDYSPPWHRADPNPIQSETLCGTPAAGFSSNTRGPGNTTHPCSLDRVPPLSLAT